MDVDGISCTDPPQPKPTANIIKLYRETESVYDLGGIHTFSYAYAVTIHAPESEMSVSAFLTDQRVVDDNYSGRHSQLRCFPQAFHEHWINFQAYGPPDFLLTGVLNRVQADLAEQNEDRTILRFSEFQGYNRMKSIVHPSPQDLKLGRGYATGGLAFPSNKSSTFVRKQSTKALEHVLPGEDSTMTQEAACIRSAYENDHVGFRFEQVLDIDTESFIPDNCTFWCAFSTCG